MTSYNLIDSILAPLYSTHAPSPSQCTRTRPMSVLALGFSRSGTDSLKRALHTLGYGKVYHGFEISANPGHAQLWHELGLVKYGGAPDGSCNITRADFERILHDYDATTDMPVPIFAREVIQAYPEAKVILNTRKDLDAWWKSNMAAFGAVHKERFRWFRLWPESYFHAEIFWLRKIFEVPLYCFYRGSSWDDGFGRTGKWVYEEHIAVVKGLLKGEDEKLLEWTVEDGWGPLCAFLGKEVPEGVEFPTGNTAPEMLRRIKASHEGRYQVAHRRMMLAAGVLFAAVAAAAWRFRWVGVGR